MEAERPTRLRRQSAKWRLAFGDQCESASPKEKKRQQNLTYRAKLKTDPRTFASFRKSEADRVKLYRSTRTTVQQDAEREKDKLRKRALRKQMEVQKLKESLAKPGKSKQNKKHVKLASNPNSEADRREKARLRQMKRRHNMSEEKKQQEREKRMIRYHQKKINCAYEGNIYIDNAEVEVDLKPLLIVLSPLPETNAKKCKACGEHFHKNPLVTSESCARELKDLNSIHSEVETDDQEPHKSHRKQRLLLKESIPKPQKSRPRQHAKHRPNSKAEKADKARQRYQKHENRMSEGRISQEREESTESFHHERLHQADQSSIEMSEEDIENIPTRAKASKKFRKTNAQRCKEYRERLKNDLTRLADFTRKKRESCRTWWQQRTFEQKKAARESARLRQQKRRRRLLLKESISKSQKFRTRRHVKQHKHQSHTPDGKGSQEREENTDSYHQERLHQVDQSNVSIEKVEEEIEGLNTSKKLCKTNAQRSKEYRERLKNDPAKLADFARKKRESCKIWLQQRTFEQKLAARESARLRQQKRRHQLKLIQRLLPKVRKSREPGQKRQYIRRCVRQPKSLAERREQAKLRQRKRRHTMSEEKKRHEKEKRREKYLQKKGVPPDPRFHSDHNYTPLGIAGKVLSFHNRGIHRKKKIIHVDHSYAQLEIDSKNGP